jgi:hypothetical protein
LTSTAGGGEEKKGVLHVTRFSVFIEVSNGTVIHLQS